MALEKRQFTPQAVLRRNLHALMNRAKKDKHPELASQIRLGKKAGVGQATIGRILSAEGENAGIETVEKIANAFGLQGWQLMIAGMDPDNPPVLQPVSKEEQALYKRLKEAALEFAKK